MNMQESECSGYLGQKMNARKIVALWGGNSLKNMELYVDWKMRGRNRKSIIECTHSVVIIHGRERYFQPSVPGE